ncbi:MAG: hypothetical protein ACREOE_12535 [Gemmatimonadales bacterium]
MATELDTVMKALSDISGKLTEMAEDINVLGQNDTKLQGEIEVLKAGAGGPSSGLLAQQLAEMQEQLGKVEARTPTRDAKEIKRRHEEALRKAGERERAAGVRIMWHPELDDAKRGGIPLCRKVANAADLEEAIGLGYCDTLDKAAATLVENEKRREAEELAVFQADRKAGNPVTQVKKARFKTAAQARAALHNTEQRFAKGQVASVPVPQAPVQQPAA